jgi:hypothetical protein
LGDSAAADRADCDLSAEPSDFQLMSCLGHQVVDVDHIGMLLVTRTAARLRILCGRPDPEAVLAWAVKAALTGPSYFDGGA